MRFRVKGVGRRPLAPANRPAKSIFCEEQTRCGARALAPPLSRGQRWNRDERKGYDLLMQKLREYLALLLIALLPLHALLVTVLTKMIAGPNHAPMPSIVIWKEATLAVLVLIAAVEICRFISQKKFSYKLDAIDLCILALTAIAVVLVLVNHNFSAAFIYGFRYDLLLPLSFLVLRRVPWSPWFVEKVGKLMIVLGVLLSLYGLLTLIVPESFFVTLGYSTSYSLYFPDAPLTDFQKISGVDMRRMQSTFSGPNQFGIWLLLPIAFTFLRQGMSKKTKMAIMALLLAALFFSFCRSAWIALVVLAAFIAVTQKNFFSWKNLRSPLSLSLIGAAVLCVVLALTLFPDVFVRLGSSRAHFTRPVEAVHRMLQAPLGSGLGMAGPATNRLSDSCVFLRPQDDPAWAKQFPNLCVYLGDKKVQPMDRECSCPFLPENWFLQIGVELGFLGMAIYLLMLFFMLKRLWKEPLSRPVFLGLLGVCIAGIFLHSFEDFGVAATVWLLISNLLPSSSRR